MILEHYGTKALKKDKLRNKKQEHSCQRFAKPKGLWVSVRGEDDWPSWCRSEQFRPEYLEICSLVTLKPDANVLVIKGPRQLKAFNDRWAEKDDISKLPTWPFPDSKRNSAIPWYKVAEKYDGIVIAPYVWQWRLKPPVSNWYYGWDCASGCIWNARTAIESVQPVGVNVPMARVTKVSDTGVTIR